MDIILDNNKEIEYFLISKGVKKEYFSNGKIIPDRIVVNGNFYRKISRSGFPFTINAIDYVGNFMGAKKLF